SIFHLEESPGNISAADVDLIAKHPAVEVALPIAVGDNYQGYRLIGTTLDLFERVEYAPGQKFKLGAGQRPFAFDQHEAVLGSFAARQLGLKAGDKFHPYHGLIFD
ncbi:MAG: ABC transporter permease, partial [Verrucomicrobiota bacterium]